MDTTEQPRRRRPPPTPEQEAAYRRLLAQGYTMCVILPDGSLCPGYDAWALEWELDMRDLQAELDRKRNEI